MAASGLVDTDVLIDYLRGVPAAVDALLALDEVSVSVVSVAELFAGFRGAREQADIGRLLAECQVLPVTEDVAREAGLLKKKYFASHSVQLPDALIAATALAHGLALVSLNVKHYPMVAGLAPAYSKAASAKPARK